MSQRILAILILLSAIVFMVSSSPRAADDAKPEQKGHLVAIVDCEQVFQNSYRYKTALEKLSAENLKIESDMKTRNETLRKIEEELKSLQPGSPDFNKRQEEATLLKHELQARIQIQRAKYEQKRVTIEVTMMQEIDHIIEEICRANDIAMVTNVDTRQQRFTDLESAERHRQRRVMYYNPGLDITNLVLRKTNDAFQEDAKLTDEERAARAKAPVRPGPTYKPIEPAKK